MKKFKGKKSLNKSKNISKLISQQQAVFNVPDKTIEDGADKLPTIQPLL